MTQKVLNSGPLTPLTTDINELQTLTPGQFLTDYLSYYS